MTRKPAFWITLALLGLAGSFLALRLFPIAFPILTVDIEMDRQEALAEARTIANQNQWEPAEFRQAASFAHLDPAFQTYMELEGGGLEELNALVGEGVLTLYAWRVRHFAEETVEEAEIRFSPRGDVYGFRLLLSEDTPGSNLGPDEAREMAVFEAAGSWGFDPSRYELLESSQEEHPGGRIDHTFVFERSDVTPGEARIRMRLKVGGDQLTEVTPILHVSEAFLRRYQETRNTNESVSLAGTIVFLLLFLVLGGGVGTVHLLRKRWIEWKAPLVWGGVVSGLMALDQVNTIPLTWMGYNTAMPAEVHLATLGLMAVVTFVGGTIFLALLFMTGEGLMRLGFPDQIQQWKVWASGVAQSTPVLGRTSAPYLLLGVKLGFVVTFYLFTSRYLGWWSPASALAAPDLLATRFPWLTAVSTSLFAALSEETIFRAIPIGAAAILGRRHGRPWAWIWGAVVLQALVFGASHANYPQQPAYARVVEIFPTYLAWGIVCVFFGLIPAILGHYLYDLVFFSLPLFAAHTGGIWLDRSMVIAAGILPLVIVYLARLRKGGASQAPEWSLNRSWRPPLAAGVEGEPPTDPIHPEDRGEAADASKADPALEGAGGKPTSPPAGAPGLSPFGVGTVALAGLVGLTLWVSGIRTTESPSLTLSRAEVEAQARGALESQGVILGSEWTPLFSVQADRPLSHRFVWEHGTEEEYRELIGTFLSSPGWRVRFVSFEVPPEERAEEYGVGFFESGTSPRVSHGLPEGRPGETLSEDDARALALDAIEAQLGISREEIREVSADENVRPARTDWTFIFRVTEGYPLEEGEGRVMVRIAGNEVTGTASFVHVPEEWEREWQAAGSKRQLPSLLFIALLGLLALGALVLAIVMWTRRALDVRPLRALGPLLVGLLLVTGANEWPNAMGVFTTQLSLGNQVVMVVLGIGLGSVFLALGLGLLASLGHTWLPRGPHRLRAATAIGLALGFAYLGATEALAGMGPSGPPGWPDYAGAATYLPWLSITLGALIQYVTLTSVALVLMGTMERLWGTRWVWAAIPLTLVIGFALASNPPGSSWFFWIGGSVATAVGIGIFWVLCRRMGWAVFPAAAAVPVLAGLGEIIVQNPFPGSILGATLGIVGAFVSMHRWTRAM